MFKTPKIIVNFKTYKESTGAKAVELAQICDIHKAIVCVTALDVQDVCKNIKTPVFGQHVDFVAYGSHTGKILPVQLKKTGAKGTLLNHSENRLNLDILRNTITLCHESKLKTVVCVQTAHEAGIVAQMGPDAIAIEPPELIGGTISVTSANPQIIIDTLKTVKEVNPKIAVLCGAGVKTREDVAKAVELGCKGVLLASGVMKAKNPDKVLKDLKKGLKK